MSECSGVDLNLNLVEMEGKRVKSQRFAKSVIGKHRLFSNNKMLYKLPPSCLFVLPILLDVGYACCWSNTYKLFSLFYC